MVEVVTLRSLTVQWKLSPFLWLWNPQRIPTNISTWRESCQNSYLPWRVVTCFVFSCDEMWILVLSNELRLHMVHNYILIHVRNWLRILGKWNVVIFNIASIRLPDKGLTIWPTDLVTQCTICIFFLRVFLTFPIHSCTCSCIPGDKGERWILVFFT